jgi:hypothetical protein
MSIVETRLRAIAHQIEAGGLTRLEFEDFREVMFAIGLVDHQTISNWLDVCLSRGVLRELDRQGPKAPRVFGRGKRFLEYSSGTSDVSP